MRKEIFQHCQLTVSEDVQPQDKRLHKDIQSLGFTIIADRSPLVLERTSTSQQDIVKLVELLASRCDPQEDDEFNQRAEGNQATSSDPVSSSEVIQADTAKTEEVHSDQDATKEETTPTITRDKPKFDKALGLGKFSRSPTAPSTSATNIQISQSHSSSHCSSRDQNEDIPISSEITIQSRTSLKNDVLRDDRTAKPETVSTPGDQEVARSEKESPTVLPSNEVEKYGSKCEHTPSSSHGRNGARPKERSSECSLPKGSEQQTVLESRSPLPKDDERSAERMSGSSLSKADRKSTMRSRSALESTVRRPEESESRPRPSDDYSQHGSESEKDDKAAYDSQPVSRSNMDDKAEAAYYSQRGSRDREVGDAESAFNGQRGSRDREVEDAKPASYSQRGSRDREVDDAKPASYSQRESRDREVEDAKSASYSQRGSRDKDNEGDAFRGQTVREDGPHTYRGPYSGLNVQVHKADITRLQVDCIVNAANSKLKHGGGVARAISKAAGRQFQDACEEYTSKGKTVDVTDIFVAPGGNLPARYVMNAVGPRWDAYSGTNKKQCTDDLRRTVLRCLVEAERLCMTSVALPSISAAIFRVPKELCARSYVAAVKHFDYCSGKRGEGHLRDIQFVDVDEIMLNCVQDRFLSDWNEPLDEKVLHKDDEFYSMHLRSKTHWSSKPTYADDRPLQLSNANSRVDPRDSDYSAASIPRATTKSARTFQNGAIYEIRGAGIQVVVSNKASLNFQSDIVATIGDLFDKLSDMPEFKASRSLKVCDDFYQPQQSNYFFFTLRRPYKNCPRLFCCVKPNPINEIKMMTAFENLETSVKLATAQELRNKGVISSLVITSSILYPAGASSSWQYKNEVFNTRLVRSFAVGLYHYLQKTPVRQVIVTASTEAVPILCQELESYRDVTVKKTTG